MSRARACHRQRPGGRSADASLRRRYSYAALPYALVWVVVAAARLWFAYASNHDIRVPVGTWMSAHRLTSSALVDAFVFLALATVLTRTGSLAVRPRALRGAAPPLAGSPPTSRQARRLAANSGPPSRNQTIAAREGCDG